MKSPESFNRVEHYENFPVASWLCPAHLRRPIAAIYHYARTADDIADEGDATAPQRLADLADYRKDLQAVGQNRPHSGRWPDIFDPLSSCIREFQLPIELLQQLLDAFEQDIRMTESQGTYRDLADLLAYCKLSANPIGRLLLHLYGVESELALRQSDAICSALQLINFWQDLSRDIPRGRHYLSDADCDALGVQREDLKRLQPQAQVMALIASQIAVARELMQQGQTLVHQLPGRIGWELRLVVQGGLRILEKIETRHCNSLQHRPVIQAIDIPLLIWRCLWM